MRPSSGGDNIAVDLENLELSNNMDDNISKSNVINNNNSSKPQIF